MRKKYIFINSVVLLFTLIIFLISSISMVSYLNERNTSNSICNYLSLVEKDYDGTNMEEVGNKFVSSNVNLRITFISKEGNVLFDTTKTSEENHLDRPEIVSLGTIEKRYSETTNERMYYLASFDENTNTYIRISLKESYVSDIVNKFTTFSLIGSVLICIVFFGFILLESKLIAKPLKKEVYNLSKITNTDLTYSGDDVIELSNQIEGVRKVIDSNMQMIKMESSKLNYIIDNMNNGIVILNGEGKINIINNFALKVLDLQGMDLLNKSFNYAFKEKNIVELIEKAIDKESDFQISYCKEGKYYVINISSLNSDFVMEGNRFGVALFIYDVTESKRLEKVKLDFFANASHELKSPLTTIIGYQQMISEGIITEPKELLDATNKTIKEATRMNQIIIEMLDLSKLEMDINVEKKELSLASSIDSILEAYEPIIKKRKISIIKNYDNFTVIMNIEELYHIIRNLIDNAIKYNKDNGSIVLTLNKENRTFSIKDTGIGISLENQERIFERFYRVDKAKSKELGGTGLGLAIVKHICMNNNIKIEVNSSLDEGAEFIIGF
ncbi:MAG: ATP-binding protein [Bacillales bacterium]|nr:ATP-binding protein [Bacillales bacterium]